MQYPKTEILTVTTTFSDYIPGFQDLSWTQDSILPTLVETASPTRLLTPVWSNTHGSVRSSGSPNSPNFAQCDSGPPPESKIRDFLRSQCNLKETLAKIRSQGLIGLDENQTDHLANEFLEDARFLGKFSPISKLNVLDTDMLSHFCLMLARGKPDSSGKLFNIYLSDKLISAILESLYWLPNEDNTILRAISNTPRIISALSNLIICIHVAAGWAAYLLSALFLLYERLPDEALELAPSIINAASRLIKSGPEEYVDGCLLLINNMTAMGGEAIASHVASHWDLMNELKRSMRLHRHNHLRIRRIASIFHHLSRCESVASILISSSLPLLLAEVQNEFKAGDGRLECPLHVGLAVLALANLSPVTGNICIQDRPCLHLVVKFLQYAKDGKSYQGIFFRVPDILRALRFLCSKEENIPVLIDAGLIDIIQQLLRTAFVQAAGPSDRRRIPLQVDVRAVVILLLNMVKQDLAVQRATELKLASEVELLLKSSDPDVGSSAMQLLWVIRDRERVKLLGHEVISSVQRFSSAVDVEHRPKEMVHCFLSECNMSIPLAEACHALAAILQLREMETLGSEHYLQARSLLATLQSKFGELERSSDNQLRQAEVEKDLLAQSLQECRDELAATQRAAKIVQGELASLKEKLGMLSIELEVRTKELDQEKRLGGSLQFQHGALEARLRQTHQAELESLRAAFVQERDAWERQGREREERFRYEIREREREQQQTSISSRCSKCQARQGTGLHHLSLSRSDTVPELGRPAWNTPGVVTRALQEDVDGLTHLLISAASPASASVRSALSQSRIHFANLQVSTPQQKERAAPPVQTADTKQMEEANAMQVAVQNEAIQLVSYEQRISNMETDALGKLVEEVLRMKAFLPS